MVIPSSSTEFVHVSITGPAGVDLSEVTVQMAVVAHREDPVDDEWRPAEWLDGAVRLLVGPGTATALTRGDYHVWVSVDPPGPENITRRSGHLGIT